MCDTRGRGGCDTRGPRRQGGTLNPPGTAARSCVGRAADLMRTPGRSGQSAPGSSIRPPVRGERKIAVLDILD